MKTLLMAAAATLAATASFSQPLSEAEGNTLVATLQDAGYQEVSSTEASDGAEITHVVQDVTRNVIVIVATGPGEGRMTQYKPTNDGTGNYETTNNVSFQDFAVGAKRQQNGHKQ